MQKLIRNRGQVLLRLQVRRSSLEELKRTVEIGDAETLA